MNIPADELELLNYVMTSNKLLFRDTGYCQRQAANAAYAALPSQIATYDCAGAIRTKPSLSLHSIKFE
jgi:hypothetical protein